MLNLFFMTTVFLPVDDLLRRLQIHTITTATAMSSSMASMIGRATDNNTSVSISRPSVFSGSVIIVIVRSYPLIRHENTTHHNSSDCFDFALIKGIIIFLQLLPGIY